MASIERCSKERLQDQLAEVALLQSMYPGDGEMTLDEPSALQEAQRYISGQREAKPRQISFTVKLGLEQFQTDIEMWCSLPFTYPDESPELYAKCTRLSRVQQKVLNDNLRRYVESLDSGESSITQILIWLQEAVPQYIQEGPPPLQPSTSPAKKKYSGLSRLWIYSHHIYRKELLRKIPQTAKELDLTGFVLPGKPGIICVEGYKESCDEYWQRLKYPNWKHISCKHRQDADLTAGDDCDVKLQGFCLFKSFEELAFEAHGDYGLRNDYHMDLGQFRKYLKEYNCGFMFQIFFGLDGKSPCNMK